MKENLLIADSLEAARAQLFKHLDQFSRAELQEAIAYIATFYTAGKAGALTKAPPLYMEEVVGDVMKELNIVTIPAAFVMPGAGSAEKPN